jgi:hypothetical protein
MNNITNIKTTTFKSLEGTEYDQLAKRKGEYIGGLPVAEDDHKDIKDAFVQGGRLTLTWASLRIPVAIDASNEKWSLSRSYSSGGKYVQKIARGGSFAMDEQMYRSPEYDRYNKEEERATTTETLLRLRSLIAAAYGHNALAAEIDEDLAASIKVFEDEVEKKLHDGGGYSGEVWGTTGEAEKVTIEFSRSGNSFDVSLYAGQDNKYITTRSTAKVATGKEGWQKSAARAIIKSVTPLLAERWRKR